jgi:transposase
MYRLRRHRSLRLHGLSNNHNLTSLFLDGARPYGIFTLVMDDGRMTLIELPNDIDSLKQLVLDREAQIAKHDAEVADRDEKLAEREAQIKDLESQLAWLKRRLFGKRGEKIHPNQLLLFKELQAQLASLQEEQETEEISYTRRKGHGRRLLPDDLPTEDVEYPLENSNCPCCGDPMRRIGEEVTEELDYNPGSLLKRRHIRPKYACRQCEEGVYIAPMPPRPIDKGLPGPGLLSHVLTSKYSDHTPLNRLQGMLRRHGVDIGVATMCDWVARMSDLLTPIYDGLKAQLLAGSLVQSDDTEVPYLLKSEKKQAARGYLWTYLCASSRLVLYDFTTSRSRAGPSNFLDGFSGSLVTDGCTAYNEAVGRAMLTHAGCWSHARRKYYDARFDDRVRCGQMLKLIQQLFGVERKAKELREASAAGGAGSLFGDAEHLALRQAESAPLVEEIRACVDAWSLEVLPRGSVGKAVAYMCNQWHTLTRFMEDGAIPLHNNASEHAMRHVVLGRRNWTFAGSVAGGHRAAKIYSIVVTCRRLGLDPFAYLRDVIDRLPRGETPAALLPATWKTEQLNPTTPTS